MARDGAAPFFKRHAFSVEDSRLHTGDVGMECNLLTSIGNDYVPSIVTYDRICCLRSIIITGSDLRNHNG
jgi:hypothetical protein